ncbi:PLP-dependent aminotransferase family protein [Spirillospora sp. NPDC048911]|uniref:aminotransferase-like domain-containing protein n=1 Tax=Spirillospora sp. NPDC048911 TaxID=3364527 RepID=UPI00372200B8
MALGPTRGHPHRPDRRPRLRRPRGSDRLREVLAAYLRRVRAAAAEPEHLVICGGFVQGLDLLLRTLAHAGHHAIAVEDPGYGDDKTRAAITGAGLRPVPVPVDDRGLDVAALAAADVRAVLVTPAHQRPTGVVLTPERRRALTTWAAARDALIIEDDYDAEFRYDREPVGSLQGLAPQHVAVLGTVSKSLAPAIRLGWVLAPPPFTERVARQKSISDRGSPVLDQLALAALLRSGRYDRHLRRTRTTYAAPPRRPHRRPGPPRPRRNPHRPSRRLSRRRPSARLYR